MEFVCVSRPSQERTNPLTKKNWPSSEDWNFRCVSLAAIGNWREIGYGVCKKASIGVIQKSHLYHFSRPRKKNHLKHELGHQRPKLAVWPFFLTLKDIDLVRSHHRLNKILRNIPDMTHTVQLTSLPCDVGTLPRKANLTNLQKSGIWRDCGVWHQWTVH